MVSHQDGEVDAGVIFSLAEIAKDSQGLWNRVTGAQYVRMFYSIVSQFTSKKQVVKPSFVVLVVTH